MKYTVEVVSDGMIYVPSYEDWFGNSGNIKIIISTI
jgi:hypothetical protein